MDHSIKDRRYKLLVEQRKTCDECNVDQDFADTETFKKVKGRPGAATGIHTTLLKLLAAANITIESTFATVRLRTSKSKGADSQTACLAMVFKPVESGHSPNP